MAISRAWERGSARGVDGKPACRLSGNGCPHFHFGKAIILTFLFAVLVSAASAIAAAEEVDARVESRDGAANPELETGADFSNQVAAKEAVRQGNSKETNSADSQKEDEKKKEKEEKSGEFVAAPIPISSPAIGTGLEWAVGYMFRLNKEDKETSRSVFGAGGLFTNNGSRAIAFGGRFYGKNDKYRLTAAGGGAKINANIYGVGKLAGDRGLYLPLQFKGAALIAEPLFFRLHKGVYLGARFQYRDLTLSLNRDELEPPANGDTDLPPALEEIRNEVSDFFKQRTVSLGPRFQWDTRDNAYYPLKGFFLDSGIDLFGENIGSKWTYQYTKIAFNKYTSIAKRQILAYRAMGCLATGDHVPIYDLCLFGTSSDLRGYTAGRYQDRRMFATQAEYRLNMPPKKILERVGLVFFGGFGGVGSKFSDIGWSDLLPAAGGGLRFRLTNKDRVNFRVDYGIGKGGHTFSMGIGEAF
jgi:hypothetical protein